jgi:hypothetical protein
MPAPVRQEFERRQRQLLPTPESELPPVLRPFIGDSPLTDPDRAGPWFDRYGAEVYLSSAAEAVRSWWDLAVKDLPVGDHKALKALAARLTAVAPRACLIATLPELESVVDRPSVADYLGERLITALNAKLANALRRTGAYVSTRTAATAAERGECRPGAQSVESKYTLQGLAKLQKSRWGNPEAQAALRLVCSQGRYVPALSKSSGIPRSTLQRFKQGLSQTLKESPLGALIDVLQPMVIRLAERENL